MSGRSYLFFYYTEEEKHKKFKYNHLEVGRSHKGKSNQFKPENPESLSRSDFGGPSCVALMKAEALYLLGLLKLLIWTLLRKRRVEIKKKEEKKKFK